MRLGIVLRTTGPTPKLDMDLVLEAERLGYDSAWTSEAWGGDAVSTVSWVHRARPRSKAEPASFRCRRARPPARR